MMTTMDTSSRLLSIHAGKVAPLGPNHVLSAFVKSVVIGPVRIEPLGILGDEQADLTVHGGAEKAVYGYAFDNYAAWRAEYPQHSERLVPGGFGENLCIEGLREADLCVGDIHRVGSARLQVCQPRQPCSKLALYFADKKLPKAMIRSGRSGWYYRVLKPGKIVAGEAVELDDRPNPDFPFTRLVELVSGGPASRAELGRLQSMAGLAQDWRLWADSALS